jgi:hypothetical protein
MSQDSHTPAATAVSDGNVATIARKKVLPRFTVVLSGSGLAPTYPDGCLLTVSAFREPLPGDVVIAAVPAGGDDTRALFINAQGDLTNHRGLCIPFDGGRGYELLGTVVASQI